MATPRTTATTTVESAEAKGVAALCADARALAVKGVLKAKAGDNLSAIALFEASIDMDPDSWILWKHLAMAQFDLWRYTATLPPTNDGVAFLERHKTSSRDAANAFLQRAYDTFIVAMEYAENKTHPALLLRLGFLYVELHAYEGALTVCTLLLETCRDYKHKPDAIFLTAAVASMLQHPLQSSEYFSHLLEAPPYALASYQLHLIAGMQCDKDAGNTESHERARILYEAGYQRLLSDFSDARDASLPASVATALTLYQTSRKTESERLQLWIADPALWEELACAVFAANHATVAASALEYAIARGGGNSASLLLVLGRVHLRLGNSAVAQTALERALYMEYYSSPATRYYLGLLCPPWAEYFAAETRGATQLQRLSRGHCGRRYARACRHARSQRWQRKWCVLTLFHSKCRAAALAVAERKARELAREAAARDTMYANDVYLLLQRLNAAARRIQSLYHIQEAKKLKAQRRDWAAKHRQLLERVLRHGNERWVQACFASCAAYVQLTRIEKEAAALMLQSNVRLWLARRRFLAAKAKEASHRRLVALFLGQRSAQRRRNTFLAWYSMHTHVRALKRASASRLQSWWRGRRALWEFRLAMAHRRRVLNHVEALVLGRHAHWRLQCFRHWATYLATRMVLKHRCATRIQRRVRGLLGRKRARRLRGRHVYCERMVMHMQRTTASRLIERVLHMWLLYLELRAREKDLAATLIQRCVRGHLTRRQYRFEREYHQIYYPNVLSTLPLVMVPLRLVFLAWKTARRYRSETQSRAAHCIQRAYRHSLHQRRGRQLRHRLQRQHAILLSLQRTFYGIAKQFFDVLRTLRQATSGKRHAAAVVLQRSLRGWLARRVVKRLAAQHVASRSLMARVVNHRSRQWKERVLTDWKALLRASREKKCDAVVRIQRRYRALVAMRRARTVMDKKARQLRLLEQATAKPIARCFQQWASILISNAVDALQSLAASPLQRMKELERAQTSTTLPSQRETNAVPTMLFFHVLTRVRNTGLCHLPPAHGFDVTQLRQLFSLATSVISDGGPALQLSTGQAIVDALYLSSASPVTKLILYNHTLLDLVKLSRCLSFPTHHIQSLVLGGTKLSTRHVTALALALLPGQSQLEQLVLESCSLGNGSGAVLARALCANKTLWKLDLSRNHLSDPVCREFATLLLENGRLQVLSLNANDISDVGVLGAFVPALRNLPSASLLESMQLQSNRRITKRGAAEVLRAATLGSRRLCVDT
ncbi:hypothetical protein SDRG_01714 [Saprolegnia diclina VS20]|uniref:Uncharacterized protein n=1 Tax=Saprolegnia diclina (strain VS20) TaxID=1156394 RepID=T0SCQ0_SAPDV|nr:hypothetical protein SDRG_01714 [Saprolegnia diclina VS20]EQC40632.1 hypothetical protein SDRG_01714 [Saprolegnia diclina VS20]|eukprot:XP_008605476.1 hypothetical protein SDRG_01714 [Saprolegnia diclina VS20]